MLNRHIKKIAKKYISGKASRQEKEILFNWYNSSDSESESYPKADEEGIKELKERMKNNIHLALDSVSSEPVSMKTHNRKHYLVAAALAGIVITGMWFWHMRHNGNAGHVIKMCEYKVPKKQRSKIVLPDSSIVWLNADSYIRYNENNKSHTREVTLRGEAFFDVKHNAKRPLIVIAHETVTKVLGTAFNVKAYENSVQITVTRGKVQVLNKGKTLAILKPAEQVTVTDNSVASQLQVVKTDAFTSWAKGDIEFNNETFEEVAATLGRRFNVTISFTQEKLKNCRFIASFNETVPLEKIVTLLCKVNNTSWKYGATKEEVIISGRGCEN